MSYEWNGFDAWRDPSKLRLPNRLMAAPMSWLNQIWSWSWRRSTLHLVIPSYAE